MRLASPPARNSRARHARFRGEKTANVALMSDRSRGRRTGRRGCCGVDDCIVCFREANSNQLQVRDESALCRGTL